MSLEGFGLNGKVFHTPGHTNGCVSLVLEDGRAFTGDLVTGKTVTNDKPSLGSFADSLHDTYRSWIKILQSGAKIFYPAHGGPFTASELEYALDKHF
jgi:glyoxylase-like metal-dependent hydrolase (beta-lactamase superfamily II)